jgi:hypothetical protein
MNSTDILKYGHGTITGTVNGLVEADWHIPGACGFWSIRQIIAHLTSFEHLLVEILELLLDSNIPTPTLAKYGRLGLAFNDEEVTLREGVSVADTWAEYEETCSKTLELITHIPLEMQRRKGVLSWYGDEYDLEDFLVYTYYGHKREHGAQITAFRDILDQQEASDIYA